MSSEGEGNDRRLPIPSANSKERCQACQLVFEPGECLGCGVDILFSCCSLHTPHRRQGMVGADISHGPLESMRRPRQGCAVLVRQGFV